VATFCEKEKKIKPLNKQYLLIEMYQIRIIIMMMMML